jgi:hypothetical protein
VHADGDPHLPAEDVTERGKVLMRQRMGRWSHFPHLSIFILLFIMDTGSEGVSSPPPPCPCHCSGGAPIPSPLPPCPQSFTVDTVGLPSRHILR